MPHRTLHQLLKALTFLLDVCLIGTSILVAYWLRFESGWLKTIIVHKGATPPLDFYFRLIPLQTLAYLLTLRQLGLYRIDHKVTFETAFTLFKASGIALIATLAAIFFLYHAYEYSRWVMILATAMSAVFLFFDRLAVQRFREAIQHDFHPERGEPIGERQSDAARGAGDHGDLVFELFHRGLSRPGSRSLRSPCSRATRRTSF